MPILRIVQQYNNQSRLGGIIQSDTISFDTKEDGLRWLSRIAELNQQGKLDWDLIDYEWALLASTNCEILENPTGGFVGSLLKGVT